MFKTIRQDTKNEWAKHVNKDIYIRETKDISGCVELSAFGHGESRVLRDGGLTREDVARQRVARQRGRRVLELSHIQILKILDLNRHIIHISVSWVK